MATEMKRQAMDQLNGEVQSCARCRLAATRTNALRGEGTLDAELLLVAFSPGARENVADRMFVGPSGVLDRLLGAAGITRDRIYMTNLIKCSCRRTAGRNWLKSRPAIPL